MATFDLEGTFKTHNLDTAPPTSTEATEEELLDYFKTMYTMRRMEITCDNEYKARAIRGFCHLYDGQEAIATGINDAFTQEDSWITSYRCHCVALIRGGSVEKVLAELFGLQNGYTKGKGGSMHFYNKEHNFYGGQGIVGAQVPVGVGLAFANKYKTPEGEHMPVALSAYGDGAANQGQIWEAANMAALWKLPAIFCCENNSYGMGTSVERHTSNPDGDYYKMGNAIPGVKIDGMNVLSVREGMKFVKEYCASGNGPIYVEMNTYRYHGHSMSDPGTTYRSRDEIAATRSARDPIEFVKKCLIENNMKDEAELKEIEKSIRKEVQAAAKKAKSSPIPPMEELYNYVYAEDGTKEKAEKQKFIRMPQYKNSVQNA
jgi:pyruvate dehydrogenase E1 component alpha subunit